MAATATIYAEKGGADDAPSATPDTVTNLRYKEADNNTQDLLNPVTIPPSGTKWSYWKTCYAEFTGTFTQIDNVKLWVDTFNWTGVTLWIDDGLAGLTHSSATDAGYDIADGLNNLNTHTHITTPVNHGTTHTSSGTAKSIRIDETGNVIDTAGEETTYWVTALEVGITAVAGTQTARTENLEYDEI